MANKYLIGFLVLVVLTASAYIIFNQNELKINVSKTSTTFYVNQTGLFETAGVEYNSIYNGTKKLSASTSNISVTTKIKEDNVFIYRTTNYLNGLILKDTYYFQGTNNKKENFPVYHTIQVINGKDFIYEYKVNKLDYSGGLVKNPKSPLSFGKNMKIEWQDGYYYSNLAKLTSGGELKVRYKINSNNEIFNVRLFDPVITQISPTENITTSNSSILLNFNISSSGNEGISEIKFNWDSVNYSIYDDSLVLFMNFDNRSALGENSTHVKDLSKYGNNGTVVGGSNISWTPNGKYGGAFNFSGGVNYISVSNINTTLSDNNAFSVSFWFKVYNLSSQHLFNQRTGADPWVTAKCQVTATQNFSCNIVDDGKNAHWVTSSDIISTNTWYYGTLIYNGTTDFIYVNGVKQASTSSLTTVYNSNGCLALGAENCGTGAFLNGSIDDFTIWNKALSSAEILEIYASQLTKYNSQNWSFLITQNLTATLNSSTPNYNWLYQLTSSNSTSSISSNLNTITQTLNTLAITANFTTSLGIVRNDFYGMAMGDAMASSINISNGMSCTLGTVADYTKERTAFLNSGVKVARMDMLLGYGIDYTKLNSTFSLSGGNYKDKTAAMEETKWAYDNGISLVLIAKDTPAAIANITISDAPCDADKHTCLPNNYTQWCYLIRNYINNVTNNGEYLSAINAIEVWNEPESATFFLANLSTSNGNQSIRSKYYNELYNQTYNCIKTYYPTLSVGGSVNAALNVNQGQIILDGFLSNFSNQMDFVSFHEYRYDAQNLTDAFDTINYVNSRCANYNANCSRMILSEFNLGNLYHFNSQTQKSYFENNLNLMLNNYPSNLTIIPYKFSSLYQNQSCSSGYNYTAYNQQGDLKHILYNVTKSFATYCPAGSTVYQSTSDDSTIKTVTCKDGNKYNIIIINSDTNSKNVTINNLPNDITNLTDSNGNIYQVVSNSVNLGIMDSYDILYLGSPELNVSLGNNIGTVEFRPQRANSQDVWAVNQTNTKGVFNISNTGLGTAQTIGIRLNQTQSGWGIECNNQTSGSWINLTTNYQTIYSDLSSLSSFQVWCRADLNYPTTQFKGRIYFNITS